MKYIGAHVSAAPTVAQAPLEAHALGATAFAFNVVHPQRWTTPPYSASEIEQFRQCCSHYGFSAAQVLPHSAFVVNLGSPDTRKLAMSRRTFIDELQRCHSLGLTMLNFHPGSHLKEISEEACLDIIADSINYAHSRTEGVVAVIENTAGQGSNVGYTFEHLAHIIGKVHDKSRVGVCIDTCHATAAGYDMSTPRGYADTWELFSHIVGFEYLRGMHINDALKPPGSRIDRHASIGAGTIGLDFFRTLMADSRFDGIPMILETPEPELWSLEIATLRSMASGE